MATATQHQEKAEHHLKFLGTISDEYKALYNASLDARYQAKEHWVAVEEVRQELIDRRLREVQSYVASHAARAKPR
jgi:hypothetical protein